MQEALQMVPQGVGEEHIRHGRKLKFEADITFPVPPEFLSTAVEVKDMSRGPEKILSWRYPVSLGRSERGVFLCE